MSNSIEVLIVYENLPFYIKGVYETTIDATFCCNFTAKVTSNSSSIIYKLPTLQAIYDNLDDSKTLPAEIIGVLLDVQIINKSEVDLYTYDQADFLIVQ